MRHTAFSAIVVGWSVAAGAQTHPGGAQRSHDVGATFVRQMSRGQFVEAAQSVDDSVKAKMGPDVLQSVWADLSQGKGELKEIGTPSVRDLKQFIWVLVPCEWAEGRCRLKVVLNPSHRVIGLFVVPPAIKSAGIEPAYLGTETTTRAVMVGKPPWELPGTLTLPREGKPIAAMVLVHGSGPSDRDETLGPNKPFRDLALGLAGKGVASLRYEKRTHHHRLKTALSPGRFTVDQEVVEDALLALDTLRAQPESAGVPTYVLGHSLGGILAPEIATKDGRVAGAILLAAPARSMTEVTIDQFRYFASLSPGAEGSAQVEQIVRDMERIKSRGAKPGAIILGAPASYWYDLLGRDGATAVKTAAELKGRLLVIQGGRDYQSTTEDFELWQAALGKRPGATLKLFPDLNHLFAAGEGKAIPDEYSLDETHVDSRVIETIAAWCGKQG